MIYEAVKNKLNIIFVVSALHGGGAERVIATLANGFAENDEIVTILMIAGSEQEYPLSDKINVISIGQQSHGKLSAKLNRIWNMRSYFKRYSQSTIISFSTTTNMFTILASFGLNNRVIVSERNDPNRCTFKIMRNMIYLFGKRFVFQTEDAKRCFTSKIQNKSVVIPNPLRNNLPEPYCGVREKKIAAVGRLELQKNYPLLLKAFAEFHQNYPEYELHIFGKGSLETELKEAVKLLHIDTCVIFEGFHENILEIIRTYSMYVLSSDYEGIPNSLIEALAMGVPCVATNCPIGGPGMCISNNENGLLVETGNVSELQRAMEQIAGDTDLMNRYGEKAIKTRELFSEKKILDMWYSELER